jgi:hypothetical protein
MQLELKCPACASPAAGRFCAQCGSPLEGTLRARRAWRVAAAGALLLMVLALTVLREGKTASATAASNPEPAVGAPPDLSAMTPRERFDRLYNRVMRAAESGDTATLSRFAPMAFAAYQMLDTVDADARYHAAVLDLHVRGDTAAALRLADSILTEQPRHLFGFLIRATAAQLTGNEPLRRRAKADFLAAWESEQKAGRPEYRDHQAMLEQFRTRP